MQLLLKDSWIFYFDNILFEKRIAISKETPIPREWMSDWVSGNVYAKSVIKREKVKKREWDIETEEERKPKSMKQKRKKKIQ